MEDQNEVVIATNVYGDVCIRKARRKRQKLLIPELVFDYANNTMLHGLPYITRTGLTLIEKIFWLITFVASVSMCLFFISKVWFKWQTSPVIVTVSEQLVPVSMVPFPSVTICPQSKCKVSVYNFTNEKVKLDAFMDENNGTINETMKEQIAKFDSISNVCQFYHNYDLSKIYPGKYANSSVIKNILEVAPNYTDVFTICNVHGQYEACEDLFDIVVTSEGICYNINSLAASEIFRSKKLQRDYPYLYSTKPSKGWSMEHGYSNTNTSEDSSFYPVPGTENGAVPDVEVVLRDEIHERDQLCNAISSGFKVYIQHPADLPQSSLYYYAVLNTQVSSMALSFSILNISESLRGHDPEIRQCYFPDERYLKYFSLYTANNCRIECLSNITYKTCGCVDFYMPHASSKRICTESQQECMTSAREKMIRQESVRGHLTCHCLPPCNSVDYEAEILMTEYNLKQFLKVYIGIHNYSDSSLKGVKFSKLEMSFGAIRPDRRPRQLRRSAGLVLRVLVPELCRVILLPHFKIMLYTEEGSKRRKS